METNVFATLYRLGFRISLFFGLRLLSGSFKTQYIYTHILFLVYYFYYNYYYDAAHKYNGVVVVVVVEVVVGD